MRWHKLVNGRIVASLDCADGDDATRRLDATRHPRGYLLPMGFVVSDTDWRALHYRHAVRHIGPPLPSSDPYARIQT